jgi:anti-anti-sigma factor
MAAYSSIDQMPTPTAARRVLRVEIVVLESLAEAVVRVTGEVGVREADDLEAALLHLCARRPRLVSLDLSGVGSLSYLGVGVLVTYCRGVVRAGGRVRLAVALQGPVREALERARLLPLLGFPEGAAVANNLTSLTKKED